MDQALVDEKPQQVGYCFKCRKNQPMVPREGAEELEDKHIETKKKRNVHFKHGRCQACGTNTSAIVKG